MTASWLKLLIRHLAATLSAAKDYRVVVISCATAVAVSATVAAPAVRHASLSFEPPTPYLGEPFKVVIEVAVTPGVELEQLELGGLPDTSRAQLTNLVRAGRRRQRDSNEAIDLLRYTIDGRGVTPFAGPFICSIRAMAVERVSSGFFSHTRSFPTALRTTAADLEVRPLPATGRPDDFTGAVGQFSLRATAIPTTVAPGDIITLSCAVSGHGWLADATLSLIEPAPDFKIYPPQTGERQESPPLLSTTQVIIPLSTNATAITPPSLSYFDPAAGEYRTARAEPIHLTFAETTSDEPATRRIDATPAPQPGSESSQPEITINEAVVKLHQMMPLALALLAAVVVCAALYRFHRLVAWLCAIVILAAGIYTSRRLSQASSENLLAITATTTCRLAPSQRALPLFDLHPGDTVTPLESAPGWLRIRTSGGREAWLPTTGTAALE